MWSKLLLRPFDRVSGVSSHYTAIPCQRDHCRRDRPESTGCRPIGPGRRLRRNLGLGEAVSVFSCSPWSPNGRGTTAPVRPASRPPREAQGWARPFRGESHRERGRAALLCWLGNDRWGVRWWIVSRLPRGNTYGYTMLSYARPTSSYDNIRLLYCNVRIWGANLGVPNSIRREESRLHVEERTVPGAPLSVGVP